jgi:hypothetical protein
MKHRVFDFCSIFECFCYNNDVGVKWKVVKGRFKDFQEQNSIKWQGVKGRAKLLIIIHEAMIHIFSSVSSFGHVFPDSEFGDRERERVGFCVVLCHLIEIVIIFCEIESQSCVWSK